MINHLFHFSTGALKIVSSVTNIKVSLAFLSWNFWNSKDCKRKLEKYMLKETKKQHQAVAGRAVAKLLLTALNLMDPVLITGFCNVVQEFTCKQISSILMDEM